MNACRRPRRRSVRPSRRTRPAPAAFRVRVAHRIGAQGGERVRRRPGHARGVGGGRPDPGQRSSQPRHRTARAPAARHTAGTAPPGGGASPWQPSQGGGDGGADQRRGPGMPEIRPTPPSSRATRPRRAGHPGRRAGRSRPPAPPPAPPPVLPSPSPRAEQHPPPAVHVRDAGPAYQPADPSAAPSSSTRSRRRGAGPPAARRTAGSGPARRAARRQAGRLRGGSKRYRHGHAVTQVGGIRPQHRRERLGVHRDADANAAITSPVRPPLIITTGTSPRSNGTVWVKALAG